MGTESLHVKEKCINTLVSCMAKGFTKHFFVVIVCSERKRGLVHENMALRMLIMILASFCLGEYFFEECPSFSYK